MLLCLLVLVSGELYLQTHHSALRAVKVLRNHFRSSQSITVLQSFRNERSVDCFIELYQMQFKATVFEQLILGVSIQIMITIDAIGEGASEKTEIEYLILEQLLM